LCGFSGCKPETGTIDWQQEVHTYEQKGWKYEETFGTPGVAGIVGNGESSTARTIDGYWVEKGQRHDKEYKQDSQLYCVLVFGKSDGDSFLIVMSKEKPGGESK
jgi:hypothetical protein